MTATSTTSPAHAPRAPTDVNLSVRRLRVDLSRGFPRTWIRGDDFRTQYFNALSMSFPVGEQFFIDAVKGGVAALPESEQPRWQPVLKGFVGQEATHRFLHAQFNDELDRQGLVNRWQDWARRRIAKAAEYDIRHHVAITAAYEHFTAVLATAMLTHPEWLEGAEPDLVLLWRWHAVEESEHKAVALDVYRALAGNERFRRFWFLWATTLFLLESTKQTVINLHRAGTLWRARTWWRGFRWTFGPGGLFFATALPLLKYLRRDFHPNDLPEPPQVAAWVAEHASMYRVVGENA